MARDLDALARPRIPIHPRIPIRPKGFSESRNGVPQVGKRACCNLKCAGESGENAPRGIPHGAMSIPPAGENQNAGKRSCAAPVRRGPRFPEMPGWHETIGPQMRAWKAML